MNGKRSKLIRKALGYKKTPNQEVERGGPREKDGSLYWFQRQNNAANQYRWWKQGVTRGTVPLDIVARLARQQAVRQLLDRDDLHSEEENE